MKRAIVSDIHGNLEALEAVFADIERRGIRRVYCLGDVVGYGPNPRECIDLVMLCEVCLLGCTDSAVLSDSASSDDAPPAIRWTREQLQGARDEERNAHRWEFLRRLPHEHREQRQLFLHGSARRPLDGYVFPEDIYNQRKMEKIFAAFDQHCFQGRTRVPGVFTENCKFWTPEEIDYEYLLNDEKAMINVGSVGQPRDGDSRACYVTLDDSRVTFRRVDYDLGKTIRKIEGLPH